MLQRTLPKIPAFETGEEIVRRLASLVRPKVPLSVSQWAQKYISHYDAAALPYLAEIMDACSDPDTAEVGDMGPAQAGKSMVGEAFIGWSIEHDPAPFMVCQADKSLMETFIRLRINPLVAGTPVLAAQLAPVSNADNMYLKVFRSMFLLSAWPVENQFRQRSVCRGWLDDYDGFPADIQGKGDAVSLLDGRMTTFKGRDTKLVSSSPAREDGAGIEAFVAGGTDERLHPVCPECGERSEFDLIRDLKFSGTTPEEAAASAYVVCPANGCTLDPDARHQLLQSLAQLPNKGFVASRPHVGKYRRTFRRSGLLAFTSWSALAREWREAQIAWEMRQDEGPMRAFYNVRAGKNYRSAASGEKPVEAEFLKKRREKGWKMGTVPRGVKVVHVVVDVQHDRFECSAIGFGKDRESWLIDRFEINVLDDGLTGVSPFVHAEHWRALLPLFGRKYPLAEVDEAGKPVGHARILSVVVDTGGSDRRGDQATAGAKWFWNAAVAQDVHPTRITLMKGGSNPRGKLMPPGQFADQKVKGGAKRSSAKLWVPNVHAIKNMIDARLRVARPGTGFVHLPEDLSDAHVEEITAEQLEKGKWIKVRARNETWDHLVQGEVAMLKPPFAQSRTDMNWVPRDFRIVWPKTVRSVEVVTAETVAGEAQEVLVPRASEPRVEQKPVRAQTARRRTGKVKASSWMGRLGQG